MQITVTMQMRPNQDNQVAKGAPDDAKPPRVQDRLLRLCVANWAWVHSTSVITAMDGETGVLQIEYRALMDANCWLNTVGHSHLCEGGVSSRGVVC